MTPQTTAIHTAWAQFDAARQAQANDARDARRYRWLRERGHLNQWWSVQDQGMPREQAIDTDIDGAMQEERSKEQS